MKRKILLITVFILLMPISSQPASAIFGFGKCEKVNKQLNSEQAIGFENWKIYDKYRDELIKKSSFNFNQLRDATNQMKIVLLSNLQIYKQIENNNSCFKTRFVAKNRQKLDKTQIELDNLSKANAIFDKLTIDQMKNKVTIELFNYLKNAYTNFADWKTGKLINKS